MPDVRERRSGQPYFFTSSDGNFKARYLPVYRHKFFFVSREGAEAGQGISVTFFCSRQYQYYEKESVPHMQSAYAAFCVMQIYDPVYHTNRTRKELVSEQERDKK